DEIGYEIPLAIDHVGHVGYQDVIRLAKRLEKYNVTWMEDVAPWMYTDQFKRISESTTVPICTGEDIYLAENFVPLLSSGAVSVVHPDILTIGGAAELKKLGDLCEKYGTAMAVHMAESPVACLAAVHTAAAIQNVLAVEFHSSDCPEWVKIAKGLAEPFIEDGFIKVPEKPGLGIDELDEEMLKSHAHKVYPGIFEPTDEWNNEWANDRSWS
ncbi:MAG: mandelate racemase/muconate lactonizing enzyme family protein, partial [Clostridia bacterium]|nr:mandelate racemase/muconate lactonizing enzyme family protein [Clostridia bacterium]